MAYDILRFTNPQDRDEELRRRKEKGQKKLIKFRDSGIHALDLEGMDSRLQTVYCVGWPQR